MFIGFKIESLDRRCDFCNKKAEWILKENKVNLFLVIKNSWIVCNDHKNDYTKMRMFSYRER